MVICIYSTLGLAQQFAGELRDRGILDLTFSIGLLLIIISMVLIGIRLRPSGLEIGIWVGVFAAYIIAMARMAIPEERGHLIEYSILAAVIFEALRERKNNGRPMPYLGLHALVYSMAIALVDELIQFFLPSRVFDPFDIVFDFLAASMAIVSASLLGWVRKKVKTRR